MGISFKGGDFLDNISENPLALSEEEMRLQALTLLSKLTTSIPDNIIKLISKDVELTKDSIISLNNEINAKLRAYDVCNLNFYIDIKFVDSKIRHFSNASQFESEDFSQNTSCIEYVVLTWKMKIQFNYMDLPQDQSLIVKFSNGIKPQEMFQILMTGTIEDASNLETQLHPVVVQSFFTGRRFGTEMISLVEGWVNTVERKLNFTNNSVIKLIKKHPILIATIMRLVTLLVIVVVTLRLMYLQIDSSLQGKLDEVVHLTKDSVLKLSYAALLMILVLMFADNISKFFSRNIYRLIDDYGQSFIFNITKDDKDRNSRIRKQNTFSVIRFIILVLVNIAVNIGYMWLERIIF